MTVALLAAADAAALSLTEAYEAALKNDPAYRAAFYTGEAGKENRILGRSALLPSVSGVYAGSRNNSTIEVGKQEVPRKYISRNATVQVRQPLFSLDAWARYKQGKAESEYAEAVFDAQSQEVILRVTTAYFDVLLKEDQLALATKERDVYIEQRNVNNLLFKKGEGTSTDMIETQSRLDLAEAQVLEAQDALATSRDTLAALTGGQAEGLWHLRSGFRAVLGDKRTFDEWKSMALATNPEIKALTSGVEVATQEVNKQRAGHVPRVELVGSYGKQAADSITTFNQDTTVRSIGFQMSIPLYAGGAVSAATRQSVAQKEKARADLQAQTDKVLVTLRKNYNAMVSSGSRIDALIKAVDSANLLVKATEKSIQGGVRINLDLLNAQRQLSTAQRDLAQARYNYMLAWLNVRAGAGTLTADDVKLVTAYFE
ncbi:type I secretion protein TolC [Pseudoduganella armeniaca]|uniref:Type I secretion protein TolC n=2 Tax=Pseudoduganella armeniaca TaxID=2072590 RepID=A0A2R4CIR9_9BURK|nr:type I secretion protein TolC [Pseudoduganella armeniaca]